MHRLTCHPVLIACKALRCKARAFHKAHPRTFTIAHGTGHAIYFGHAFATGAGFASYLCGALAIATAASLLVSE
jgi:hypothetical protein